MLPVDAHVTFQIIAVVLGAVVLWVVFVIARLPPRTSTVAKKADTPAEKPKPDEPEPEAPEDEKDD